MTDDATHRLSTEGADPLLLAGVADANLLELQRSLGVRVGFRGDTLTVQDQGVEGVIQRAALLVIDRAIGRLDHVHRQASHGAAQPLLLQAILGQSHHQPFNVMPRRIQTLQRINAVSTTLEELR